MFWNFWAFVFRFILKLRYKIEIRGLDKLEDLGDKGLFFLPNHSALIEPIILYAYLWSRYKMRPLAVEYIYRTPLLQPVLKASRALCIPDFEASVNQLKIRQGERATQEIVERLKEGDNFLFYPSGKLKSSGKEILGGTSGAHEILEKAPKAKVVLIRTTGLWGSSFSRVDGGASPPIVKTLSHACKALFKGLIFFLPRRSVLVEIEPEPPNFPRGKSRIEFNRYLENWYNQYPDAQGKRVPSEPLNLVSYSPWRLDIPVLEKPREEERGARGPIAEETREKIYKVLRKILHQPNLDISPEMSLSLDLGMDSLNIAELISFLARNYDVEEIHPSDVETVQAALEIAQGLFKKRDPQKRKGDPLFQWADERERPSPFIPEGETIPEVFLKTASRLSHFLAMGDDLSGPIRYSRTKKAILVLAAAFAKWPEQRVGVMLPASVGAFLTILALQMAGKTPVMLNWTLGPRYLEEMVRLAEVKRVISSWRFLDKLAYVDFGSIVDQLVLLEDIRKNLKLSEKLKGALASLLPPRLALSLFLPKSITKDSEAVVLFTSGTESMPKGVPLTHHNILTNQRSLLQCQPLAASDAFYGILPPFHSFGFSVAGLIPLLIGMKVAFYPDPTNGFALAEGVERWKITIFCAAPSFAKGLFYAAKEGQLKTLRLVITGAEKATAELYQRVADLKNGAVLIEGYGITECSPVLTLNRPNTPAKGVGHFLPDVKARTIHPETLKPLAPGEEGELCVQGPNIFHGYLGSPRDPFIEIEGEKWYRTGDLGKIEDGCLILSGRLKRFIKAGGEMISLSAIEETLKQELIKQGKISPDIPAIAVVAEEKDPEQPQIVLCTTIPLEKEAANEILRTSGFSRLVKIHAVQHVEEIPLLGTGKTDFRKLQENLP